VHGLRAKFESFTLKKNRELNMSEAAILSELDIMTDNTRNLDVEMTPTTKKKFLEFEPDDYQMEDGETRVYIDPKSLKDAAAMELKENLKEWINQSLGDIQNRISINNLETDLKDGMVLKILFEKHLETKLILPCGDFVQSKERQMANLEFLIKYMRDLQLSMSDVSAKAVITGEIYPTLLILLRFVKYLQRKQHSFVPDLPKIVNVTLLRMTKKHGHLQHEKQTINLMGPCEDGTDKRDGFDTLIDHAPEKLHFVKQSLIKFTNDHLASLGFPVDNLETDFSDGTRLILLLGALEGYFIPLYSFKLQPATAQEKLENVQFAFKIMTESGLPQPRNRPYDIVNRDLKSTLRIIYSLFINYKK